MIYQKISFTVKDFDAWKPGFVAHSDVRKDHTCQKTRVYTLPGDKNKISVVMEWADKSRMEAFAGSDSLKEAMKNSGVISPPDIAVQEFDFDLSGVELQFETDA